MVGLAVADCFVDAGGGGYLEAVREGDEVDSDLIFAGVVDGLWPDYFEVVGGPDACL